MAERKEPSEAQRRYGDFAPALVHFTDDVRSVRYGRVKSLRRRNAA